MLSELHGNSPVSAVPLPKHPDTTIEIVLDSDSRPRLPNNDAEIIYQAALMNNLLGGQVVFATRGISQMYRARAAGLPVAFMPPATSDEQASTKHIALAAR
jgi:hypothetical protein